MQDILSETEQESFCDSFATESGDDSLYLPTPERKVRESVKNVCIVPNQVCFMDLNQLDKFMKQLNQARVCATPGCQGDLEPIHVKSAGQGGAVTIGYTCNGCVGHPILFETSSRYEPGRTTEIGIAIQVAFIVAGCTYMTYYKTLKHALGINAVQWCDFQSTIEMMYPIVKLLVDRMCGDAKDDMRRMDQGELGSWNRAVTSADGTWMTRGFHSRNATFSIRNYYNGALLYRKHLCQSGSDTLVEDELFKGTSKSAEGYAARLTFGEAKKEGMNVAIQWQDADSSSSKAVKEHFPNAEVMICGGHAGRAHKKQLEKLSKMKHFAAHSIAKYGTQFPSIGKVVCHCSRHKPGCGCFSDKFIERARNNFSLILSTSESAKEFTAKVTALARHARDEHEWDDGRCDFHPLRVCSCKKCEDKDNFQCEGKDYRTRHLLSCPFHSLAYEIECHERAKMSAQLVHPTLKRGHSNWLEASHNVFIRFRPKHINLDRLHYVVSTELALLQSNMTYMYDKRGPQYHWVIELFRLLKLPVFDGVQAALEVFNKRRKADLDRKKTSKYERRRIELLVERTEDAQRRKEWSKKHGHDTYGDNDSDEDRVELKTKEQKRQQSSTERKCRACGSTTHRRSSHRDCPSNKKAPSSGVSSGVKEDDTESENGDAVHSSLESPSSESSVISEESDWCFEDDIISGNVCTCGAISRAHKKDCPLSSRNRYGGRALFPNPSSADTPADKKSDKSTEIGESDAGSSRLGKRNKPTSDQVSSPKRNKSDSPSFKVGDYVSLHVNKLTDQHIPCRVVQVVGKMYRLYCRLGVLRGTYVSSELRALRSDLSISVGEWRTADTFSLSQVTKNAMCLQQCDCALDRSTVNVNHVCQDSDSESGGSSEDECHKKWLCNPLYTLTSTNREEVLSPTGWLSDSVIHSAQLLMLQQFPHVSGLQTPVLQQTLAFQVHKGEFVQIICVGNSHWCTVSNISCDEGEVKVYDSLYSSISNVTLRIIASLVCSSASQLVVRMMDVGTQSNSSDCGVLAIAFAYDVCSGADPCTVKFDCKSIRQHLADCLEKCCLSRFPVVGERRSAGVKKTRTVDLHCSCRLPEVRGDKMAECDTCKIWYHQHCMDIPDYVFDDDSDVPWTCKTCTNP